MNIGLFTDALAERPLHEVLDWVRAEAPEITRVEIGTGGYSPAPHCDLKRLLRDRQALNAWRADVIGRDLELSALNVSGNPLHPDPDVARRHDADLRDTIRLAAELGVDRVVAMSGCPGAGANDRRAPHFSGGGWLPDLEGVAEEQWRDSVEPYWRALAEFAAAEHPGLLICFELHPGTYVYNAATFTLAAELGTNLAVNLDPSHFFWQSMDPLAILGAVNGRVGHAHGKDTRLHPENLALNGVLDNRWPGVSDQMPWNFATVGAAHDASWWTEFVRALASAGPVDTISIEFEDPFVGAEESIAASAKVLAGAISAAGV